MAAWPTSKAAGLCHPAWDEIDQRLFYLPRMPPDPQCGRGTQGGVPEDWSDDQRERPARRL
jgi:hypothetical protein